MVFSRIVKIVSAAATPFSAPKSSTLPYVSSGLSPPANSVHDYGFANSKQKNNLRLSSSLQDLSVYRQLDPEGVLLFALQFYYSNWSQGKSKFYVVLDCGSTGTRVYVYQATINHKKDGSLPFLLRSLPEAGVRRLPSSDSQWLLEKAWSILKSSSFLCQREWIKTTSGVEEAYYGWIALNYHTGILGTIPKKATFGALDLGGSSLQVTFENEEQAYNDTNIKLSIGPVNHHLSAYSLSGYGLNDAFDKFVFSSSQKFASIYKGVGSPLSGGIGLGKRGKPGVPIHLIGAPKWEECRELAKFAVNLSEWSDQNPGIDCDLKPCALADNLPHPYGQFYAMSGFFVVYRFFNLSSDATLDDALEKGQEFCEKTWDIAKNSVAPQPFMEQYCFRAPYIVFLLREGLHITERQLIIGSGSITWTLGIGLLEAGKAFSTRTVLHRDGRVKMPLSPTVADAQQGPVWHWTRCNLTIVPWLPVFLTEVKCIFKSRRSQSREDLNSSVAEVHLAKV
ncbi:GDA1/CD39 nucleoside phosphatase family protein [Actinidia rufa]|uniref:GDA1/CD39 nucleoside phosphatase family protein n=1 Tax=Actinidia rufa TaxID=165716 RepID=A0A7J0E7Z0_9ERIC|nr:GDA1/CD39 nucleoside phosphatase family protein [Actinidia rufa]